ncbi:DUF899 family protein [Paenirhodobacter sp.]|uniref:DUF899 family protein n=1 Tax=Paenirhodobacter sp. TaxID=1965326 RepID=UPI003B50D28B
MEARERDMTHQLDTLRVERRQMPWVRIDKPYRFMGPDGEVTLADLFGTHSQLAVYHFMLAPRSEHVCSGYASSPIISTPPGGISRRLTWPSPPSRARRSGRSKRSAAHGLALSLPVVGEQ